MNTIFTKEDTAIQEIYDIIKNYHPDATGPEFAELAIDFLEDGQGLEAEGYSDDDQESLEIAHDHFKSLLKQYSALEGI